MVGRPTTQENFNSFITGKLGDGVLVVREGGRGGGGPGLHRPGQDGGDHPTGGGGSRKVTCPSYCFPIEKAGRKDFSPMIA